MNRTGAVQLAWALADSASFLNADARAWIFAKIGAGEHDRAIRDLLGCYAHPSTELPSELAAPVHAWVRGYIGSDSELVLGRLLDRVRVVRYDNWSNCRARHQPSAHCEWLSSPDHDFIRHEAIADLAYAERDLPGARNR